MQRRAEARDVAVAEDGEHARDQRLVATVDHRALHGEVADDRLRRGQSDRRGHRLRCGLTHRNAGIGGHAVPARAHPVVGGVVAERHRALAIGSGEDVEVVQRIAGHGGARTVVAALDEEDVLVADRDGGVDVTVGRVRAVEGEAVWRIVGGAGVADAEVVDLLVVDRALRTVVMAVRRVTRPVPVGSQKLDAHQLVGAIEHVRRHEVGDLPRRRTGATDLDSDVTGGNICRVKAARRLGRRQRHFGAAGAGEPDLGTDRQIRPVGDSGEHRRPPVQLEMPPLDVDRHRSAGERQHRHLGVAGDEVVHASRSDRQDAQPGVAPPGNLGGHLIDGAEVPRVLWCLRQLGDRL